MSIIELWISELLLYVDISGVACWLWLCLICEGGAECNALEVLKAHYNYSNVVKGPTKQGILYYVFHSKASLLVHIRRLYIPDAVPDAFNTFLVREFVKNTIALIV